MADEVVLGSLRDKYKIIAKYKPDIICLGYDQVNFTSGLKNKLEELGLSNAKIARLKPYKPEIYKTSKLINKI
jgi:glycerol-3-phosphate cytidylyltransferase-like family protein